MKNSKWLVPKYTRGGSWLNLHILTAVLVSTSVMSQDDVYLAPDVNIFETPAQVFEIPGAGDYIGPDEIKKYNFNNINDILRNSTGIYSREETGKGIVPNISLRGTATLRSAQVNLLEDGINIAPAPYSAPDSYYASITGKMHALEILKGSSQYRFGPHNTGGSLNYVTTPIEFGERYYGSVSYGSGDDFVTHDYFNYGYSSNSLGAVAILGEMYYRKGGGRRDFNIEPGTLTNTARKNYRRDELGDVHRIAQMVKVLWQLPTQKNIVVELKAAWHDMNYNQSYSGISTADFGLDPMQQYVALQMGEYNTEQFTYYGKVRAELNNNIKNTTTLYYNYFIRDWFKFDKADSVSGEVFNAKGYTGDARLIAKGLRAGTVTYVNNDRQYGAYGVMNETDYKFETNLLGKNIEHELKVGYKAHMDYIHADQQTHSFSMAVGGAMTGTTVAAKSDYVYRAKGHVGYFEEKMKIDNFDVMFGARYEYIDNFYRSGSTTSKEKMFAFAPGGGLVYNHNDNWQFFGGAYKGFNIPGPSAARDDGSPVEQETSLQKEVGMRYNDPNLALSLVGFHTYFSNLIVLDNSNSDSAPDNAGNVITKGIELNIDYLPPEKYQFVPAGEVSYFLNYTFTNANLDGAASSTNSKTSLFSGGVDGSNVPYIPDHRLGLGADYELGNFDFGINMTYQSESYGTATETETEIFNGANNARAGRIDSYTLLHLRAGYQVNDNIRLRAGANNITDLEYIATRHPSGARAGAPLTAYLTATASF